jgi:hypothetical protein
MCIVGRSDKLEEVLWAANKKAALSSWLRRHATIAYIEDQEGRVEISAERLLTEQEVARREQVPTASETAPPQCRGCGAELGAEHVRPCPLLVGDERGSVMARDCEEGP